MSVPEEAQIHAADAELVLPIFPVPVIPDMSARSVNLSALVGLLACAPDTGGATRTERALATRAIEL